MADKKITELTALVTVADTDILPVVDLSGTPTTKKVTAANLKAGLAPLASPTFTGTPLSTTAPAGTNTTQIATTAFVLNSSDDDQFVIASQVF